MGARPVAKVQNASTWWPKDSPEAFGGLLRDLEEGYIKRVAFVIQPGPAWLDKCNEAHKRLIGTVSLALKLGAPVRLLSPDMPSMTR